MRKSKPINSNIILSDTSVDRYIIIDLPIMGRYI